MTHEPIKMRRIKNPHLSKSGITVKKTGDFWWRELNGYRVLIVAIPDNNTNGFTLSQWPIDCVNRNGHVWDWDATLDRPTLEPSLHAKGIWHGWCKDGYLIEVEKQ